MNTITTLLDSSLAYALGWTLIHSLWQCGLLALVLAGALRLTWSASANARYLMAAGALAACALLSAATFAFYFHLAAGIEAQYVSAASLSAPEAVLIFIDQHLSTLVLIWLLGFFVYLVKTLLDYGHCQYLRHHHLAKLPEHWAEIFQGLCDQAGVTREVQLRASYYVQVPCVIGHLKPVVLVPIGLLLGMNQQQVEVILLHELGHVRRNDYLVGLFQSLLKTLYFFNPPALWISSRIDCERENACDDIAVGICDSPLFYANTLKEFAQMKSNLTPAMAATGGNQTLNRIKRLFGVDYNITRPFERLLTALCVLAIGFASATYAEPMDDRYRSLDDILAEHFGHLSEEEKADYREVVLRRSGENPFSQGTHRIVEIVDWQFPDNVLTIYDYDVPNKLAVRLSAELVDFFQKEASPYLLTENVSMVKAEDHFVYIAIASEGLSENESSIQASREKIGDLLKLIQNTPAESMGVYLNETLQPVEKRVYSRRTPQSVDKEEWTEVETDLTFSFSPQKAIIKLSPELLANFHRAAPAQQEATEIGDLNIRPGDGYLVGNDYAGATKDPGGSLLLRIDWQSHRAMSREQLRYQDMGPYRDQLAELKSRRNGLDPQRKALVWNDAELNEMVSLIGQARASELSDPEGVINKVILLRLAITTAESMEISDPRLSEPGLNDWLQGYSTTIDGLKIEFDRLAFRQRQCNSTRC